MVRIFTGVAEFEKKYDRMPKSIAEMVDEGFLPIESKIYSCPMLNYSIISKSIHYEQCEFELTFGLSEFQIAIPEDAFLHPQLERFNNTAVKYLKIDQSQLGY